MMEAARSTSASKEWRAAMVAAERARCSENMAGASGRKERGRCRGGGGRQGVIAVGSEGPLLGRGRGGGADGRLRDPREQWEEREGAREIGTSLRT